MFGRAFEMFGGAQPLKLPLFAPMAITHFKMISIKEYDISLKKFLPLNLILDKFTLILKLYNHKMNFAEQKFSMLYVSETTPVGITSS